MLEPFAPAIDAFAKRLARNYREVFGKADPDHAPVLRATAKLALERIAATDAPYHDALHTLFVTHVGQGPPAVGPHMARGPARPDRPESVPEGTRAGYTNLPGYSRTRDGCVS